MSRPKPVLFGSAIVRSGHQIVPPTALREAVGLKEGDVVWFYAFGESDRRILMILAEPPEPEGFLPLKDT